MSHFYGTLTGQARTTATRRGSSKSGIVTEAKNWDACIEVKVYVEDGVDLYRVSLVNLKTGERRTLSWGVLK